MIPSPVLDEVLSEDTDVVLYRGHTADGRAVLMKMFKAARPTAAEYEALRREAEVAKMAGADVAAEPECLTTHAGHPTLVLRDDGGTPLGKLLGTPMALERFFRIALELVEAIAKVHSRHLVHGDLHPADVLVLGERVELIGFGQSVETIPAALAARPPPSRWPYRSPEQTGRMSMPVDERSDLYSIGVLLFQMLTGTLPFEANDLFGWIHAHCALTAPAVESLVSDLPRMLSQIVDKLLAKPPEARYQSARGLKHDLELCFRSWEGHHADATFPLGSADIPPPVRMSGRLHGRRDEVRRIQRSFERIAVGHPVEVVLISGAVGIGKTS
ncbi:MAG: hypothetical protein K0S65_1582, partial [Labilithrix sp.]|nr:hypothetical protein [Labilithrix sp.]